MTALGHRKMREIGKRFTVVNPIGSKPRTGRERLEAVLAYCQLKRAQTCDAVDLQDWLEWFEASETVAKILRRYFS